jgi:uncharacterized cupin superfamily protein
VINVEETQIEQIFAEIDFKSISDELEDQFMSLDPVVKYTSKKEQSVLQQFGRRSAEHEFAYAYYQEVYSKWRILVDVQEYCYLISEGMKFNIDYYQYRKGLHWARRLGFKGVK